MFIFCVSSGETAGTEYFHPTLVHHGLLLETTVRTRDKTFMRDGLIGARPEMSFSSDVFVWGCDGGGVLLRGTCGGSRLLEIILY